MSDGTSREAAIKAAAEHLRRRLALGRAVRMAVAETVLDLLVAAGHVHYTDVCDEQHDLWLNTEGELREQLKQLQAEGCRHVHRGNEGTAYCGLADNDGHLIDQARQLVAQLDVAMGAIAREAIVVRLTDLFRNNPQQEGPTP